MTRIKESLRYVNNLKDKIKSLYLETIFSNRMMEFYKLSYLIFLSKDTFRDKRGKNYKRKDKKSKKDSENLQKMIVDNEHFKK